MHGDDATEVLPPSGLAHTADHAPTSTRSSLRGAWPALRLPDRSHAEWPAGVPCLGPYLGVHDRLAGHGRRGVNAVGVLVRRGETAPLMPGWKHSRAER